MRRLVQLSAVVVAAVLAVAACGGEDDAETTATEATSPGGTEATGRATTPTTPGGATTLPPRDQLPPVTGEPGSKPVVEIPDADPPVGLVSLVLNEGGGAAVEAGQTLVAQYVGRTWANAREFHS